MDDRTFILSQAATELLNAYENLRKAEAFLLNVIKNSPEGADDTILPAVQTLTMEANRCWAKVDELLEL